MATINYKGMELEEITEPQIFDPPKTMVVDDGQNSPRTAIVTAILAQSSGHSFRVLTDNNVICYRRCALLPEKPAPMIMEKSKKNKDEKTIPELMNELERARRMGAMIKAIGEKALELQSENELLKERLAAMSPEGGAPVTTDPGKDGHKSLTPGTTFDCLAVTQVQVFPFKEGPSLGKIKALATVVLNDQLQIQGLRVIDGQHGLFVGYPCDPFFKGEESRYVCAPITRQLREHIENFVLEKYQQVVG